MWVVKRAIALTDVDFVVWDGRRSQAEQNGLVVKGASWSGQTGSGTLGRHVTGHAVDLVPWVEGKPRWHMPACRRIAAAMYQASVELRIPLRWGGTWARLKADALTVELHARRPDGPHFELPRDRYPGPVTARRVMYRRRAA